MKYTEVKIRILSGDLTAEELLKMSPQDFLSDNEKRIQQEQEEEMLASKRGDWMMA